MDLIPLPQSQREQPAQRMLCSQALPSCIRTICVSSPHLWDEMAAPGGAGWLIKPTPYALHPWSPFFNPKPSFLRASLHIHNPSQGELTGCAPISAHHGLDLPRACRFLHGSKGQPGMELTSGPGRSLGEQHLMLLWDQ